MPVRRSRTLVLLAGGCLAVPLLGPLAGPAAAGAGQASAAAPAAESGLALTVADRRVVAEKHGERVRVDLGTYVRAGETPFELRTTRVDYRTGPVATLVVGEPDIASGETDDVALPGLVDGFDGFDDFVRVRIRDRDGDLRHEQSHDFCASYGQLRVRPDAPDTSPYPESFSCGAHPFALGTVMGVQAGWASPVTSPWGGTRLRLPLGRYDVTVSIDGRYREPLGIDRDEAVETMRLRVVKGHDHEEEDPVGPPNDDRSTVERRPPASEPVRAVAPPTDYLPDLRSVPSSGIDVRRGFLTFGALVWNAGPSPLVVDGFRRPDEDVMDSYQYFYSAAGEPLGSGEQVGTMKWDPREGHQHWHFQDFARYRLLDADKEEVLISKKEAFCLANTDAVDYTVPGANWSPYNTDLETACGGTGSLAVREVLDVGSGDTYSQFRPGQSFNLDRVDGPGIYFISTEANPDANLVESDYDNNTALRKIRLYKQDGEWQVKVFDVGMVSTD